MVTDPSFATCRLLCLDFDGTLVDTQPLWEAAYHAVAAKREHMLPENWWSMIAGKSMAASAVVFDVVDPHEQAAVALSLVDEASSLASTFPPIVLPGAHKLFKRAEEAGVPVRIVTSTFTALACVLAEAARFPQTAVTGGDQVDNGKPAPDIYLKACRDSGVIPTEAVAIEDSPTGIAAAQAAGLFVYALGNHRLPEGPRQQVIGHLDEATFTLER